jgi:hypothetical protein
MTMRLCAALALATSTALVSGPALFAQAAPPTRGMKKPDAPSNAHVIRFSGYDWEVRPDADGGPGPNHWDAGNVRVDGLGRLHLKLTHRNGAWRCAEVTTRQSLSFGRYQFQVTGVLDRLDPNVVFGLFNYPPPGGGPDGTNEIDIEYSRWGNPAALPASETIYPAHESVKPASATHEFTMPPGLSDTTQRFDWQSGGIVFQSLRGHRGDDQGEYAHWSYRPADSRQHVPQQPLPVHINLWLMRGHPPQDGKEVEVIIQKFSFITASP